MNMAEFTINTWQDRQLDDSELFAQFVSNWRNGEYQDALNILNNNAQLSTKAMTAGVLNTINAALTYLQDNYFENVEDVLAQNLEELNLAISNFMDEHTYSPAKQYYVNNFVWYNDQYYMCIQDSLGNLPTNTTYWVFLGLRGEQGNPGTGLNLRYTWGASTSYSQYDVVYLSGVLYVALQSNLNQNPTAATTYWQVFMTVPKTSITWGKPLAPYEGQVWIETL